MPERKSYKKNHLTIENMLQALQNYVKMCWPQVHIHALPLLKMVVRLLYDVTEEDCGVEAEVSWLFLHFIEICFLSFVFFLLVYMLKWDGFL